MTLTRTTTTWSFGGGQDYEQSIVAKDLPSKRDAIGQFIQDNKVILAIRGGFQPSIQSNTMVLILKSMHQN